MKKKFKIKAVFSETNRTRTLTLTGNDEHNIAEQLIMLGYKEPFEISEEAPEVPTEAQIDFARILEISIPKDATKADLSALIDKKKSKDSDPNPDLLEFADSKGFLTSKYIGKRALYNLVFHNLEPLDRIAFFAFSIYRWLSEDRKANLDKHNQRDVFYEFAQKQINNDQFLKSMEKYEGSDLRFFSTLKFSDGGEANGGSTNTIAYKVCSEFLSTRFNLKKTKTATIDSKTRKVSKNTSGCLSLVLFFITSLTIMVTVTLIIN